MHRTHCSFEHEPLRKKKMYRTHCSFEHEPRKKKKKSKVSPNVSKSNKIIKFCAQHYNPAKDKYTISIPSISCFIKEKKNLNNFSFFLLSTLEISQLLQYFYSL